jgi:nucleotide-binding universal stress UspA family protein
MKKILVPCDFSKPAINAFRLALGIAQQSKGTVHLLHVIELPVMHDTVNTLEIEDQEELVSKVKALQNFFKAHLHLV